MVKQVEESGLERQTGALGDLKALRNAQVGVYVLRTRKRVAGQLSHARPLTPQAAVDARRASNARIESVGASQSSKVSGIEVTVCR